jgi:hypothetical protein
MGIVERSRSLPIVFSTLLIGLSPLIPIPVVDDLITAALCRWRVKYLAEQYGLKLQKKEIQLLADEQGVGCFDIITKRAFGYVLKEIAENMLIWVEAGRAVNLLARTYYYGILLDYAFSEGLYKVGHLSEAKRLHNNIYEVRKGANTRQLKDLLKASSKNAKDLSALFISDVYKQYFKNIPIIVKKYWRQLLKRQDEISEQADQDTKNLNDSAATWKERYKNLFEEFASKLEKIPAEEIENLYRTLQEKMS